MIPDRVINIRNLRYLMLSLLLGCALFANKMAFSQVDQVQLQASGLLSKIEGEGTARVIIQLAVPNSSSTEQGAGVDDPVAATQTSITSRLSQVSTFNSESVKTFELFPGMAMEVDEITLQMLAQDPAVVNIVEDKLSKPYLDDSIGIIDANDAWNLGYSGSNYAVAILDTGVNKNHPFLSGKVVSEACYSTTYAPQGANSLCPGGVSSSTASNSGLHCSGVSGCDHGTHVAGIAAGKSGTSSGFGTLSGVAKDAKIIAIQVFSRFTSSATCSPGSAPCVLSYSSDQIRGLERVYALRNTYRIASANMSLGGGRFFSTCDTDSLKPIIDTLRNVGIATAIASGNDGYSNSTGSPGCISSAITVGSSTKSNTESSFSNAASWVDLMAPGSSIASSVTSGYGLKGGTSMATPHVAGAWAIMKSKNGIASVSTIESALESSGRNIWTGSSVGNKPRIDLDAALAKINPGPQLGFNWDKCRQVHHAISANNTWCYLDFAKIWINFSNDRAEDNLIQSTAENHYIGYNVSSINGSSFTINHVRVYKN